MARKPAGRTRSSLNIPAVFGGPAVALLAAVLVMVVVLRRERAGSTSLSSGGREVAEAEWRTFQSLQDPRFAAATLSDQAIELLEACALFTLST